MQGVKRELAYLNSIYADKDIRLEQVYDETDYIYDALHLVTDNLYRGVAADYRGLALFPAQPEQPPGHWAVDPAVGHHHVHGAEYALGRSLNIVMLAGMAFAVGNVVDNSIVVLENIFRHREMGKPRAQAALDGASEVWSAVLASTLTNMAVFLPIIFVKDEAGQLFRDIAISTSISTALSLIVALTVVPMMASRAAAGALRRSHGNGRFAARAGYCPPRLAGAGL